jgi:hypothetical protein
MRQVPAAPAPAALRRVHSAQRDGVHVPPHAWAPAAADLAAPRDRRPIPVACGCPPRLATAHLLRLDVHGVQVSAVRLRHDLQRQRHLARVGLQRNHLHPHLLPDSDDVRRRLHLRRGQLRVMHQPVPPQPVHRHKCTVVSKTRHCAMVNGVHLRQWLVQIVALPLLTLRSAATLLSRRFLARQPALGHQWREVVISEHSSCVRRTARVPGPTGRVAGASGTKHHNTAETQPATPPGREEWLQ